MGSMTARQPRRTRRRAAPAASLPRPVAGAEVQQDGRAPQRRTATNLHHREHHVTKDYSHVTRDLITVTVFGTAVLAFIVAMSFVVN
jgi:hypothetical protein